MEKQLCHKLDNHYVYFTASENWTSFPDFLKLLLSIFGGGSFSFKDCSRLLILCKEGLVSLSA